MYVLSFAFDDENSLSVNFTTYNFAWISINVHVLPGSTHICKIVVIQYVPSVYLSAELLMYSKKSDVHFFSLDKRTTFKRRTYCGLCTFYVHITLHMCDSTTTSQLDMYSSLFNDILSQMSSLLCGYTMYLSILHLIWFYYHSKLTPWYD